MKTAWIFPGGSARGVYTAGAIYALCKMNVKRPDIIIAASASAPTSFCYLGGQYEIIPNVWLNSLSTKKFVNLLRFWKIVDTNFLIDTVLREYNPLDMEKVANSEIVAYIPLTDSKTGEIKYFSNKSNSDLWQVVKASVRVPFFTHMFSYEGVLVGDRWYLDSTPASRFQLHVEKALNEDAERIVVFDNWHDSDNPTGYFWSKILAYLRGGEFKKTQLQYMKKMESFISPKDVEFIKISPSTPLSMSRLEIDNQNARKIFQRGYDDTFNNKKLRELILTRSL